MDITSNIVKPHFCARTVDAMRIANCPWLSALKGVVRSPSTKPDPCSASSSPGNRHRRHPCVPTPALADPSLTPYNFRPVSLAYFAIAAPPSKGISTFPHKLLSNGGNAANRSDSSTGSSTAAPCSWNRNEAKCLLEAANTTKASSACSNSTGCDPTGQTGTVATASRLHFPTMPRSDRVPWSGGNCSQQSATTCRYSIFEPK
mmetsp:Transcript_7820/g.11332  ORF Transcript_7820/g.11332 Transcript_7820/m.11332 type:complete len:203 (+) Transcript_7820:1228-1836(+)